MLRRIKLVVVRASRELGLFTVVRDSGWRGRRLSILCYHGVSLADEHEWNPSLFIPPAMFRARLSMLRRGGYNVLPLGEAVDRLYAGTLPPRAVALTFDDGFFDFYRVAHPLLREFGYPATVYLSTYYCRYNRPIFPVMLAYLLWRARGRTVSGEGLLSDGGPLDLTTDDARHTALRSLRREVEERSMTGAQKDALLQALAARLDVDYDAILRDRRLHLMTPGEAAELSAAGVDIQLHTHRHYLPQTRDLFVQELEDNRRAILEMTGTHATHFCYPNGVYRAEFLTWLTELGIASATTTDPGLASKQARRLLLPRFVDSGAVSPAEFESYVTGVASLLPRRRDDVARQADGSRPSLGRIGALRVAPSLLAPAAAALAQLARAVLD